jgi:hypothetical protein
VKTSHLPGSGEGLFARRPLPKGTITAFYNGIRLPYKVRESDQPKEEWSTSGYKIYINADYESGNLGHKYICMYSGLQSISEEQLRIFDWIDYI